MHPTSSFSLIPAVIRSVCARDSRACHYGGRSASPTAGARGWASLKTAARSRATKEASLSAAGQSAINSVTRTSTVRAMTKWEYVTVPLLVHATKQILDNWGQDGWELVQVVPGLNPENLVAYLKRPIPASGAGA
jgi:hypothetical protein